VREFDVPTKAKHVLQDALHFTPKDVEDNREGWISDSQRMRMSNERKKWMLVNIVTAAIYGIFLVTIIRSNPTNIIPSDGVGTIILLTILAAPIFLGSLVKWIQLLWDELGKRVQIIEGNIQLDIVKRGKGRIVYKLAVEDVQFEVSKTAFLAFKNRDQYCVYYAPHSRTIVAAEWLRE
jgi:hypothetical protein